jgi:hypothetical protein
MQRHKRGNQKRVLDKKTEFEPLKPRGRAENRLGSELEGAPNLANVVTRR